MKWFITDIEEADFGCEERMPGEPLLVLVSLESEDGRVAQFEAADCWLTLQELDVGDEWPEDIDEIETKEESYLKQEELMNRYLDAVYEMEDGEKA